MITITNNCRENKDDYLRDLSRENVQLLLNQIWELPTERVEEAIVVKLPPSNTVLPRAQHVPKPKPPTKWQQFAKLKGIDKKKKSKLKWDDQLRKWIPLYGYKRAAADKEKDWVLEVPQNANPLEDQFAKQSEKKSEKVAKNELQRLRNIAKARKIKVPRFGLTNPEASSAKDVRNHILLFSALLIECGSTCRCLLCIFLGLTACLGFCAYFKLFFSYLLHKMLIVICFQFIKLHQ